MTVLPKLSAALPNIQFIVTTHSPLVVGSVDSENIIAINLKQPTTGLDADLIFRVYAYGASFTLWQRVKSLFE